MDKKEVKVDKLEEAMKKKEEEQIKKGMTIVK